MTVQLHFFDNFEYLVEMAIGQQREEHGHQLRRLMDSNERDHGQQLRRIVDSSEQ